MNISWHLLIHLLSRHDFLRLLNWRSEREIKICCCYLAHCIMESCVVQAKHWTTAAVTERRKEQTVTARSVWIPSRTRKNCPAVTRSALPVWTVPWPSTLNVQNVNATLASRKEPSRKRVAWHTQSVVIRPCLAMKVLEPSSFSTSFLLEYRRYLQFKAAVFHWDIYCLPVAIRLLVKTPRQYCGIRQMMYSVESLFSFRYLNYRCKE